MRIATWNMNKRRSGNWEWLVGEIDPDIALVQEASPLPDNLNATVRNVKRNHRTAIYSKANDHERIKLHRDYDMGLLVGRIQDVYVLNVYANLDFKPMYLPLLGLITTYVNVLRSRLNAQNIIVAGDFNMDRRMDDNPTGSQFAAKGTYPINSFFDVILDMGFLDCMRKFSSSPVQTHRNNKSKFPWELDHMFATEGLYESLSSITVINADGLSDHYPIVADYDWPPSH